LKFCTLRFVLRRAAFALSLRFFLFKRVTDMVLYFKSSRKNKGYSHYYKRLPQTDQNLNATPIRALVDPRAPSSKKPPTDLLK
jgi:hypothetical protein